MDACGQGGLLFQAVWTAVDGACGSTDQEVGDSSSSGRATGALALQGLRFEAGSWTV